MSDPVATNLESEFPRQGMNKIPQYAIDMFIAYSRFEYAMKETGYVMCDESHPRPAWGCLAGDIRVEFDKLRLSLRKDGTLSELDWQIANLIKNPPKQESCIQVSGMNEVTFPPYPVGHSIFKGDIWAIVDCVQTARNNLFHGGKYEKDGSNPTDRNQMLLIASLSVLKAMIMASSSTPDKKYPTRKPSLIKAYFDQARLY